MSKKIPITNEEQGRTIILTANLKATKLAQTTLGKKAGDFDERDMCDLSVLLWAQAQPDQPDITQDEIDEFFGQDELRQLQEAGAKNRTA